MALPAFGALGTAVLDVDVPVPSSPAPLSPRVCFRVAVGGFLEAGADARTGACIGAGGSAALAFRLERPPLVASAAARGWACLLWFSRASIAAQYLRISCWTLSSLLKSTLTTAPDLCSATAAVGMDAWGLEGSWSEPAEAECAAVLEPGVPSDARVDIRVRGGNVGMLPAVGSLGSAVRAVDAPVQSSTAPVPERVRFGVSVVWIIEANAVAGTVAEGSIGGSEAPAAPLGRFPPVESAAARLRVSIFWSIASITNSTRTFLDLFTLFLF